MSSCIAMLQVKISGWGQTTNELGSKTPVLREATVHTISNTLCESQLSLKDQVEAYQICIYDKDGKSICSVSFE
jgi:hypothetical protein